MREWFMVDSPSIPDVLEQADIFADLRPTQLALIASISRIHEYSAAELIFEENSDSNELYVIVDGEVDLKVDPALLGEQAGSRPVTLTTLRRGQSFGEMALVDLGLRSATACSAQHETRVVIIPRDRLMELCQQHPDLGYVLMRNLAADLAAKIRDSSFRTREWLSWTRD
jgi:CRP/FNR family transcriptional regulator, cyclic AMP receptor protein